MITKLLLFRYEIYSLLPDFQHLYPLVPEKSINVRHMVEKGGTIHSVRCLCILPARHIRVMFLCVIFSIRRLILSGINIEDILVKTGK